jgi:hypothetical protein
LNHLVYHFKVQGFGERNLREIKNLKDLGVDGRIIIKYIFKKWYEGVYWIDLVQERDRWR